MPEELKRKYLTIGTLRFLKTLTSMLTESMWKKEKGRRGKCQDSDPSREYWKGFELIEVGRRNQRTQILLLDKEERN